jgi:hypothetical protein
MTVLPWLVLAGLVACPKSPPDPGFYGPAPLPTPQFGYAAVIDAADPEAARAGLDAAVKTEGQGGISFGFVVRITQDVPVYRLWNGPEKQDANGHTNRLGGWWTFEAPAGPVEDYRRDYAICRAWNDLAWVATCTLKAGAVVVIGPGQSVSAAVCGDAAEAYPANPGAWQLYVDKPWSRPAELACPPEAEDHPVDPRNLAQPR